jgi:hypothetical protein
MLPIVKANAASKKVKPSNVALGLFACELDRFAALNQPQRSARCSRALCGVRIS